MTDIKIVNIKLNTVTDTNVTLRAREHNSVFTCTFHKAQAGSQKYICIMEKPIREMEWKCNCSNYAEYAFVYELAGSDIASSHSNNSR